MGHEPMSRAGFWRLVAIVAGSGAAAYVCLGLTGGLPTWVRGATVGLGIAFAGFTVLGTVLIISELRAGSTDPRAGRQPPGGLKVWFSRLDDDTADPLVPAGPAIAIGAAASADVKLDGPGLAAEHAHVRIWPGHVDICRLGRAPLRVDGEELERATWHRIADGAVLELGGHRLRVNIGWDRDPDDARVGTRVGGRLLIRRLGPTPWGTRYLTRDAVVDRLDRRPLTDDELAAYAARTEEVRRHCSAIAAVVTARDTDGTPVLTWPLDDPPAPHRLEAAAVFGLCERLAPLHAAGLAHGALTPAHLLPNGTGRGPWFAAALPMASDGDDGDGGGAPYRRPGRADVDPDDDAAFLAPERRAGAAASARANVFALARFLDRGLDDVARFQGLPEWVVALGPERFPPRLRDAPAWAALLRAAGADDPAARPADAAALADEILRTAARTAPDRGFAGRSFLKCERCGEHLVAEERGPEIMFDGVGPDGHRNGGRSVDIKARCLGCGHDTSRHRVQRY